MVFQYFATFSSKTLGCYWSYKKALLHLEEGLQKISNEHPVDTRKKVEAHNKLKHSQTRETTQKLTHKQMVVDEKVSGFFIY